jgi:predicted permease
MREWNAYVRERLTLTGLRREREVEIVEDLARQLDDAYREAKENGASDVDARARAERHITDWDALSRQLSASPRARLWPAEHWAQQRDDRGLAARGRLSLLSELRQDFLYGLRSLGHHAGLTTIAVISLAIGIGANTALFGVMNALVFRPLPVRDPQQLVVVTDPTQAGIMTGVENGERTLLSVHEFEGLRDHSSAIDGLFAFGANQMIAPVGTSDVGEPRSAPVVLVTGAYFRTLGVGAALGRVFAADIDRAPLGAPEAVVSDAFWRDRLAADPNAVGRTITIRRTAYTVIGVLPPTFTGIVVGEAPDVWLPVMMQPAVLPGSNWLTQAPGVARRTMFLHVVGRLPPGVTLAQADASVNLTFHQNLGEEAQQIADPTRRQNLLDAHLVLRSAAGGLSSLRGEYQQPLTVLMALVGLLLLLACANVANLLLSRSTGRQRELAVRVALGAGRARLVRQLLTESVLLAAIGAAFGLFVAVLGTRVLLQLVSGTPAPVPLAAGLDAPVLAFTALVTLVTGVLFGLAPALRATRPDLNVVLRGAAHNIAGGARGSGRWSLARLLVGAQVALSLLLLVTAGLFVRSLENLGSVPLGYDASRITMFRVNLGTAGYQPAAAVTFFQGLLERVAATGGVRSATLSANGLFYGGDSGDEVAFPGAAIPAGLDMGARFDTVGPKYFATLGVPVLAGRDVEATDGTLAQSAWLNESMAQYFFKDASPIGQRMVVHYSFGDAEYEIRGVVADSRSQALRGEIGRRFYLPYFGAITHPTDAVLILTTSADAGNVVPELRRLVTEADARLDAPVFHTVRELLDIRLVRDRLTARLSSVFGVMALLLASVGLYGLLSYSVSRRVSEIGVRMAFGAGRARILGMVLREALGMTIAGAIAGIAAALAATRVLQTMLFGLGARDPLTIAFATIALIAVATLAAAVPAWRACRTDPLVALRTD